MDWLDLTTSDPTEEIEENMSSLAAGFAAQMHKREARSKGETTPGSEVSGGKGPKRSGLDEEA